MKAIYILSGSNFTPIEHIPKKFATNTKQIKEIVEEYFEERENKLLEIEMDEQEQKISCTYIDEIGEKELTEFIYTEFKPIK